MNSFNLWFQTARPRTLPLSVSGILIGFALSPKAGLKFPLVMLGCILTTLLFQILSNFANDLGDGLKGTDNQGRIGPERAVQSGRISAHAMKRAVVLLSLASMLSAGFLLYFALPNLSNSGLLFYSVLAVLCVLAAITYTVGKRAYGYHGGGDLMVFLFFGFVAVVGTRHLFVSAFGLYEILGAVAIGSWSTMVLNLNNMRDINNDAVAGKRTLVVMLGGTRAKTYHYMLFLAASGAWFNLLVGIALQQNALVLLAGIPLISLTLHVFRVLRVQEPRAYDPELKKVALSAFFAALIFFVTMLF
ncbi:MAG: 1,4-dihydroxy-2-naphthoate octaprenyltransferase [Flavobacteriia bacterium]|nr:1,4-dihydroxy-2-naphthoate octaprenyltransferase [Flavobacteriia bacterium]